MTTTPTLSPEAQAQAASAALAAYENPAITRGKLEAAAIVARSLAENAAARAEAPKTRGDLLKALHKYAKTHPLPGHEHEAAKLAEKIKTLTAKAQQQAAATQRNAPADGAEKREQSLVRAAEILLRPRGDVIEIVCGELSCAGAGGTADWIVALGFARSLIENNLLGSMADWLAVELEREMPGWL